MSAQHAHLQSSGRGGAGNIVEASKSPKLQPEDLQTPTLKTNVITTGRGGSGNMAKNTDPAETRARQDVEPVTRRPSHGATHVGRGGTGNVFKGDEAQAARDEAKKAAGSSAVADDLPHAAHGGRASPAHGGGRASPKPDGDKGWAEKGKGFLFGHKK